MVLICDIGNSTIDICIYMCDSAPVRFELSCDRHKSADEYAILIDTLFKMRNFPGASINGAIIGSVVPDLTSVLSNAILSLFHIKPMTVGPGIKTSLDIKTDRPSEVGADIVANTVAALDEFDAPMIIIDFATSTTFVSIDKERRLTDVFITPGVYSSYSALTRDAAAIACVPLFTPKSLSGKNTAASVNSGVIYSAAFSADGFISRIKSENKDSNITAIATGGTAHLVLPLCKERIIRRPNLTCDGLYKIYLKNRT